jgi:hypothetical protein
MLQFRLTFWYGLHTGTLLGGIDQLVRSREHAGLARRNAWARWGCPDANGQSWLGDHFGVRGPTQTDAAGRF